MDNKQMIETMISQHRNLLTDLSPIIEMVNNNSLDGEKITTGLKKFHTDLYEHLKLENETFTVELLKAMQTKGQVTTKTEEFISQMTEIGNAVIAFLGKFDNADKINNPNNNFSSEFLSIVDTLKLRVEAEETGVYTYWQ